MSSEESGGGPRLALPLTLATGLAAGLASGLLGVGGGIIIVPLLVAFVGLTQHQSHATSLAAIIPIATVGAARFALDGSIDYGLAGVLAAGSLVGAPFGAFLLARSSEGLLKLLFGLLVLAVSAQLLLS